MTKGETIIAEAKKKLVDFIIFEAPLIYYKFGWAMPEDGDDFVIPTGDLEPLYINVEADNSYLDVEDRCYEDVEIAEIVVSPDREVWFTNEDGDEWNYDALSVEELAHVADAMDRAYTRKYKVLD